MTLRPTLLPVCGRCGRKREGIRHVCRSNSSRKATVSLRLTFGTCPECKKTVSNPLTHTCKPKSDFKRRKKRAGKKRQAEKHDYQACSDRDCPRSLCVAFKTGRKLGYQQGFDDGFAAGFAAGSASGAA